MQSSSLLAVLCDAADEGDQLSEEEVVHNVFAFMIAGMDTTSTTLSHLVCCLASHPDVQRELHAEVVSFDSEENMIAHGRCVFCHTCMSVLFCLCIASGDKSAPTLVLVVP